jgi:hypothetical protein
MNPMQVLDGEEEKQAPITTIMCPLYRIKVVGVEVVGVVGVGNQKVKREDMKSSCGL